MSLSKPTSLKIRNSFIKSVSEDPVLCLPCTVLGSEPEDRQRRNERALIFFPELSGNCLTKPGI